MSSWTDFFKLWKYSEPVPNCHSHHVDGINYIDVSGLDHKEAEKVINNLRKEQERVKMEGIPDIRPDDVKLSPLCHVNGTDEKLRGLVVMYIDVGQIPPFSAEAFVERLHDLWKPLLNRLPNDIGALFVPIRPNSCTRTEITPLEK